MEYVITSPEPTDWKIKESDFTQHLSKRWLGIEIKTVTKPDDYYVLEWVIKVSEIGHRLDGALHRGGGTDG